MLNGYVTSNKNYILKIPIYLRERMQHPRDFAVCVTINSGVKSLRVPQALAVEGF